MISRSKLEAMMQENTLQAQILQSRYEGHLKLFQCASLSFNQKAMEDEREICMSIVGQILDNLASQYAVLRELIILPPPPPK